MPCGRPRNCRAGVIWITELADWVLAPGPRGNNNVSLSPVLTTEVWRQVQKRRQNLSCALSAEYHRYSDCKGMQNDNIKTLLREKLGREETQGNYKDTQSNKQMHKQQ